MVSFDPWLFPPQSNDQYQITVFWGPYTKWETNPDVIIFSDQHTQKRQPVEKDSPYYDAFIRERDGYNKYVTDNGVDCSWEKCYQRHLKLSNGGEILVLIQKKLGN